MAIDMKEIIARAALSLLMEKKAKKITVKDIVSACSITRQAFYYHFADIPDLIRWTLQQGGATLLRELQKIPEGEGQIRHLLLLAVNAKPYLEWSLGTNYGREIEKRLLEQLKQVFAAIGEKNASFAALDPFAKDLALRYHCYATMGILRNWTDEQTEQIDRIAHEICLLITARPCHSK